MLYRPELAADRREHEFVERTENVTRVSTWSSEY